MHYLDLDQFTIESRKPSGRRYDSCDAGNAALRTSAAQRESPPAAADGPLHRHARIRDDDFLRAAPTRRGTLKLDLSNLDPLRYQSLVCSEIQSPTQASSPGMPSRTRAKHPACCSWCASSSRRKASSAVRPCTLKPAIALTLCGVRPR